MGGDGSFFDSSFGGVFDFNRDGKEDLAEQFIGYKFCEECSDDDETVDISYSDSDADDNDDASDDNSWRDSCDDENEFEINPEDYNTEEEYEEAVCDAQNAGKDTYEASDNYDIDSNDIETEEEYEEDLTENDDNEYSYSLSLQLSIESTYDDNVEQINETDYKNKRRYNAACAIAEGFDCYINEESAKRAKACCNFILKKADTVVAANYLAHDAGFLYSQAVKDNFKLPVSLPDEDETREFEISQVIGKIAKRDVPLSLMVWNWCIDQFLPFAKYDEYAADELTNSVIDQLACLSEECMTELIHYMNENPDFLHTVMKASDSLSDGIPNLIYVAIREQFIKTAKYIFRISLKKVENNWKEVNNLTKETIICCKNYKELETIECFRKILFPLIKAIDNGMVQDEIEEWENEIKEYIDYVENECEQYAYSRKYAWRKTVPDGKEYNLDPCHYDTEQDYLKALNDKKDLKLNIEKVKKNIDLHSSLHSQNSAVLKDKNIYIYYGVCFKNSTNPYFYRTENSTIKIGDTVLVPTCKGEEEGTVVSVGQYNRLAVPYPVEKTKYIIRKISKKKS